MQRNGWFVGHASGRFAIMREVDGKPPMVGKTQATLREAIDSAVEAPTHG